MTDQSIIQAIHRRLVEAAKKDKDDNDAFVYYSEIIQMAGISHYGDGIGGALGSVFFEVNEYDRAQDAERPMLSAVAISAEGVPSGGFYTLARDYNKFDGKTEREQIDFWLAELGALREYWQAQLSSGSKTYLLTWNPRMSEWRGFQENWDALYMGHRPQLRWSCGNTKSIDLGDRVFLMRLGQQVDIKGIVASGFVTEEPFDAPHWNDESGARSARYVMVEPDVLLRPGIDELLDPDMVLQEFDWFPQRSGITIPSEIAAELEEHWQQHVDYLAGASASSLDDQTYREGARTLVSSYQYERSARAREECIQVYGTICEVCEFDFGKEFGDIGEGFIHVHHLIPISERDSEYRINPIEDLLPVCPNCHAMLHKRNPPYSIEELKEIRRQARQ